MFSPFCPSYPFLPPVTAGLPPTAAIAHPTAINIPLATAVVALANNANIAAINRSFQLSNINTLRLNNAMSFVGNVTLGGPLQPISPFDLPIANSLLSSSNLGTIGLAAGEGIPGLTSVVANTQRSQTAVQAMAAESC